VKKLLLAGIVAAAGYLGYKKLQGDKAEQDLWAEATDPVETPAPPAVDPDAPSTAATTVDDAAGTTTTP
jgi:hypothetical protein